MNNHSENPDAHIDQILQALRDTEPPTGLEARITAHIARAAEARTLTPSFFAAILSAVKDPRILFVKTRLYAFAATMLTLLLALSLFALHLNHKSRIITQSKSLPVITNPQTPPQQIKFAQARPNRHLQPARPLPPSPATPTDPDTIALAETLAPSHPAPPMPLTQQERLMFSVLRSGDREEIAALNPVERDALFARDQAAFQDFFAPPAPTAAAPTPSPTTGDKE